MHLLHISDLHFGTPEDAAACYSALAQDLKNGLDCDRLDALILSGDIGTASTPGEYGAAAVFVKSLTDEFGPDPSGIVMVPGNHDLNFELAEAGYAVHRKKYFKGDLEKLRFMDLGNGYIRVLADEAAHRRRFAHFGNFFEAVTGRAYPLEYDRQGVLCHFPDERLLILGLNSCWRIDEDFPKDADIHANGLSRALDEIRRGADRYGGCRKFAVWHHPVYSTAGDGFEDHGFLEQLAGAGFSVAFHGHIHKDERFLYEYDASPEGRKLRVIGTGTFGAPSTGWWPGVPLQYNFMILDGDRLTIRSRCRRNPNGAWEAACIWRQGPDHDPVSRLEIRLPEIRDVAEGSPGGGLEAPLEVAEPGIPERYRKWIIDRCRYMDIDRLRERGSGIRLELPEIFIPLYADPPERAERDEGLSGLFLERERGEDIGDLIRRYEYLLIRGQAGSGKTTLMKHVAHGMIENSGQGAFDADAALPVLIFLKDLKGFDFFESAANAAAAEALMAYDFERTQNGLTPEIVIRFCRAGKAFFLLDGLDEIEPDLRDFVAHAFADFRHVHPGCRIVFSGRPHGVDGAVLDRFGDRMVTIRSLHMEQVEAFIRKWFCYMENAEKGSCTKTAQEMIAELRAHPAIDALKDTPLMLTAICLLYHDGKELPGQRAELYKKFVENLLYRRFDDPEKVNRFLASLAYEMHTGKDKGIDRAPSVEILGEVYLKGSDEGEREYIERLEREFDRIEPDSGLLSLENGRYSFWHLTFQEYLTATSLVDRERRDYFKAIESYWDDPWYAEVIQLYIGYLSIQNMMMANEIIREVLEGDDSPPYRRWQLAGRSLSGIHIDRRHPQTIKAAQKHLIFVMESRIEANHRAEAGEILGRIGDPRDLKVFVPVGGGVYELSRGTFEIAPFEIGKYPVTIGWYNEFIEIDGYNTERYWTIEGLKWLKFTKPEVPRYWYEYVNNVPNAPATGICWYEARAFINWLNEIDQEFHYFLPDENQWEAVAAGFEGRRYTWGNCWKEGFCNSKEVKLEKPSAVGSFPIGDTPDGISDLIGNVWEWTCSNYHVNERMEDFVFDPEVQLLYNELENIDERVDIWEQILTILEEKNRQLPVARGGSWFNDKSRVGCRARLRNIPNDRDLNFGFRCSRKLK